MSQYAGEGYRITAVPKDDDGETVLTDSMIRSLTIEIWNPSGTKVVDGADMTFDDSPITIDRTEYSSFWFYMLATDAAAVGTWRAKVTITGFDDRVNWEWQKFRLKRDPVPA